MSKHYASASLRQSLDVLRYEAEQRGDKRSELLACIGLTNLIIAEMQEEVVGNLKAVYARLPLEVASSNDWIAPRDEWRKNGANKRQDCGTGKACYAIMRPQGAAK